ncbi:unnamed protein product [Adineta steineri]|uniref:Piezo-type mechanosensitive ion channel component n=1 Tax=Adineta steineri TaxID=433720 RepID=A0A813U1M2_9BILA|nr:unnamed protein product [Adineta steineri]CAF3551852.1 unnamed protein product [Adineta steineri]
MAYFNKSTECSNIQQSSNHPYDIDLQTSRRHTLPSNNKTKDQRQSRIYSLSIKQDQSNILISNQLLSINNLISNLTNISHPLVMSDHEKEQLRMSRSFLSVFILILLPLALLSGVIFRYSIISFIYAFLLLLLPWLGPIAERNIRTRFRIFVLAIAFISLLTVLAQIIFQSILLANKPYGHTLNNCTELVRTLRYFGLERLDNSNAIRILRLIFPDIIILAISTVCFVIIRRTIVTSRRRNNELQISSSISQTANSSTSIEDQKKLWPRLLSMLKRTRLFLQFIIVGFAAFVYPSIINSVYFIFFLTLAFIWSSSVKFGNKYTFARAILVVYTGIHLLILYLYQFGFFQEFLPPLSLWSNITGLTAIVESNCTDREPYLERNLVWSDYINPCALLLLYFYFAFETNRTLFHQIRTNVLTIPSVEQQSLVHNSDGRDTLEQTPPKLYRRWSLEQPGDQTWQGRIIFVVFSIIRVLERHSYLLSLIAMLAWSITFHSLLTLVYLLWACILWVLPNSRQWCLRMSPFFTIYGGILLILQYLVGFKVSFNQLNFAYDRRTMEQIGIRINDYQPAFIPLLLKSFYMLFFWLTLRQYINEKRIARAQGNDARRVSTGTDSYPRRLGRWLINFLTKYWIFVSCGMLLLVSIQNTVVIYRIIYMAFYLFFILAFQISFGFWRKTVATFHLTIIIYSMVILIGIYIYQFENVNVFLTERFSKELLASIGLDVVPSDVLAVKLLTPSTFLVVNILQLHYFHSGWMKLITMPSDKNIEGPASGTLKDIHAYAKENTEHVNSSHTQRILKSEPKTWQESSYKLYFRTNRLYKQITYYTWRFAELHAYKFVLFLMVLTSVLKVCAFNVTLIILATVGLVLLRLRKLINLLTLIATGLYILSSMCYQLAIAKQHIVEQNFFVRNCSQINLNLSSMPNDTAKWFGLELTPTLDRFIGLYILITIALTFDAIGRYRQRHRRLSLSVRFNVHLIENRFPILFEPFTLKNRMNDDTYEDEFDMINYREADKGICDFLKYAANFIFYRFGLEICYITTVIVIAIRLDIMAVLYSLWLGIFLISSRRSVQRMWLFYILFLIIAFPIQYMSIVGAPPLLCFNYPWTNLNFDGWPQLRRWFVLPDYFNPPVATQLIADFFQLLFACQQLRVFKYESSEKDSKFIETGGSNREIIYDDDIYKDNPTWDFVINKRHWLDQIKYAIFMYGAWIVLSIVYLAGTTRISLLGLGYLIACFYFFWYGQDFLTKRVTVMLRVWSYLVYYCFSVIFIKACLQVAVCIFLYPSLPCEGVKRTSSFCTFVDLLVPCLKKDFIPPRNCPASYDAINQQCDRSATDATLFMDGFCLIFLLLQKRIFGSYYWEHIVAELRSQAKLASQGAVLFNKISHERIEEDREREDKTVAKIKLSLNRIKEQQSKLNQSDSKAATALVESSEHFRAIRSGDYYMFEYESDEEVDEGKQDEATVAQEQILQVLTASDKAAAAAVAADKPSPLAPAESDVQEFPATPISRPQTPPEAITTEVPLTPVSEYTPSVEPKEKTKKTKKSFLIKMRLIGRIVLEYLIDLFNRHSRDYREVSRKLSEMKSEEKINQHEERIRAQTTVATASVVNLNRMDHIDQFNDAIRTRTPSQPVEQRHRSRLYRLFDSLFYFTMSRSELLCYSAMVLNHLTSGALLSMPLPLSIFLWAMLSSRPSRNYWITVITYTEAMIVIKYIFQFRFYPWNSSENMETNPLSAVNIIGINRKENAASVADLFLLLSLFLHRSILKQLGLWKAERSALESSIDVDAVGFDEQDLSRLQTPRAKSSGFMKPLINFYRHLQQSLFVRDVYASMFFCDFINMIIVIGFYSQFGERAGGNVVQTIKENKVPVAFLVILLIQFLLIIIDRALYLRRNVRGKLFFQLFQVLGVHIWLFFILPGITHIKFRDNYAAQFWYLFKCIYFGYSSIQVRLGYPKRIAGNFLMKRFNYVTQVLYRIYLLIPFLLELRTIMDWIFTDTSLGLSSWLQLEDIYSNVYLLKCARWAEEKYPTDRGVTRPKITKYGLGGSILILLILLIWFPLLFFSFSSSFYQPNPPKEVTVEIKLGGYLPIYQMTAQDFDLKEFKSEDSKALREKIESLNISPAIKDSANAFLRDFNSDDIRCVNLFATSVDLWKISQPIRDIVVNNLRSNVTVPVRFSYTITRNPPNQDNSGDIAAVVTGENIVNITADDQVVRNALIEMLNGTVESQTSINFTIRDLMPRFLHVKPKAKPEEISALKTIFPRDYYANITMGLNRTKSIPNSTDVWWEMSEHENKYDYRPSCAPPSNQEYLSMIFFNDKVSPANISFLTRYGIIGLYTTFVVVVARLLRTILQTSRTIMFNELPSVERLWHLLRDIYLVREHDMLRIEEQLFAKLLFLYRSSETLIRFTKPKSL